MKKSILICLIGLFMLAGTQYTQAQTKEETIVWIKEKLEKYGGFIGLFESFHKDVKVSPCSISFKDYVIWYDNSEIWEEQFSFNPSLIKEWTVFEDKSGIKTNSGVIEVQDLETSERSFTNIIYLKNREPEIHERMIKALLHLGTFCEQKKEAF